MQIDFARTTLAWVLTPEGTDRAMWVRDDGILVLLDRDGTQEEVGAKAGAAAAAKAASDAVAEHVAQSDPHSQYLTGQEADARYAPAGTVGQSPYRTFIPTVHDGDTQFQLPTTPFAGSVTGGVNGELLFEGIDFTMSGSLLMLLAGIGFQISASDIVHIRYQEASP